MNRYKKYFSWFYPVLILLGVSLAITFIWFSKGGQLAAGEESFSIFNSRNIIALNGNWEEIGSGYGNPTYLLRIPLSVIVTILHQLGMSFQWIQMLVYLLLIFTGLFFTYKLSTRLLISITDNKKVAIFIALFYLLNIYSMVQVWGRFLYASSFLWVYLPLLLYLWIGLFEKFSCKKIAFFIITSFVLCVTYLQPADIITLWFPPFVWSIVQIVNNRNNKDQLKNIILKSIFYFIVWLMFNCWWIYPYILLSSGSFATISNPKISFDTLTGVSKYFTNGQIMLLRDSFFFGKGTRWYEYYSQFWIWGISYFILIITFYGWIKSKKANSLWVYLTILISLSWFISKGTNPPFGYSFYSWLFYNFPFMGFLRNSYEKFGLNFVLSYSMFFGLGAYYLLNKFPRMASNIISLGMMLLVLIILVFPMWSGFVVENKYSQVPDYYQSANDWLNSKHDNDRVLQVPLTEGDSYTYNWGYNGVEPSEFLFDKPSVAKIIRDKYYDPEYTNLVKSFNSGKGIKELLAQMGIGYIILHKDVSPSVKWANIEAVKKTLDANGIKLTKSFGELDIYKLDNIANNLFEINVNGKSVENKVTYTKISPTKYVVHMNNQSVVPYDLVFKSTYNKYWQGKIKNEVIKEHSLVYGYANSWRINQQGTYNIEITFKIWPWE